MNTKEIQTVDNQRDIKRKKIKDFRVSKGFNAKDFAKYLDVGAMTLSKIETGQKDMSSYFVKKLRLAFPDEKFEWLEATNVVQEPPAPYGESDLSKRMRAMEYKLDLILDQNAKLLELYGNIADYINKNVKR